ncbi:uncharacterized protein ARMOST_16717 [Armillaria ostoyae]|uniref:Uncharacterized protein n=1 Tax=Armillaria ostoyae TaxID=47428 RepID=A0A284RX04_ARMOS|nr:uncharacterized protein ARMOST_16717 [Armillaria ostoyae]
MADMEADCSDGFEININVRKSAQPKTLFYVSSSVTSTGTTKETERLHQQIKPPEVQTRARDAWMTFDVGQKDRRTSFTRFPQTDLSSRTSEG